MTHAPISKRRGQGEDSIYWDATKNRYIGAVSLGFSPAGTRIRKKVTGRTKTEGVRDKLRDLHKFDHERLAVFVWRADRAGGDTKTPKCRRTLALARRCVEVLRELRHTFVSLVSAHDVPVEAIART